MTLPLGLVEAFFTAAERGQREAKVVSVAGDGGACPNCGTIMRRLEYRAVADGPVLVRRDVCPKCRTETRVLGPGEPVEGRGK